MMALRHAVAQDQLTAAADEWHRRRELEEDTPGMMELAERVRFWATEARDSNG